MRRLNRVLLFFAALTLFTLLDTSPAQADEPVIFTDILSSPTGITTDAAGNVYVASLVGFQSRLTKFSPDGIVIWDITYTGGILSQPGKALVTDPNTGLIWNLWGDGKIYLVDPLTGNQTFLLDLRTLSLDTSEMQDIQIGPASQFAGQIIPNQTYYVDLALQQRNDGRLDVFVTANSSPSKLPYIFRVRLDSLGVVESAKVLLISIAGRTEFDNQMGGITTNGDLVFTTIYRGPPPNVPPELAQSYQIPISFSPDFPEDSSRFAIQLDGVGLNTRGMATDLNGNFFMTTGTIGNTLCGFTGREAMVVLPANLNVDNINFAPRFCGRVTAVPPGTVTINTRKVAVSPAGDFAYVTESPIAALQNRNYVWRFSFPNGVTFSTSAFPNQTYLPLLLK
ncbi:MAG: hypothetical protein KDJ65_05215 [Anaerolineae bacterium]|nr:hypothetical protein [Anaerolineae bacterium]